MKTMKSWRSGNGAGPDQVRVNGTETFGLRVGAGRAREPILHRGYDNSCRSPDWDVVVTTRPER